MQTMMANTTANDRGTILPSAILETCLDVTDLDRARDFYAGFFGYSVPFSVRRDRTAFIPNGSAMDARSVARLLQHMVCGEPLSQSYRSRPG
jgi:hypothetical protein